MLWPMWSARDLVATFAKKNKASVAFFCMRRRWGFVFLNYVEQNDIKTTCRGVPWQLHPLTPTCMHSKESCRMGINYISNCVCYSYNFICRFIGGFQTYQCDVMSWCWCGCSSAGGLRPAETPGSVEAESAQYITEAQTVDWCSAQEGLCSNCRGWSLITLTW